MITQRLTHGRWCSIAVPLAATLCLIAVMIVIDRADTSTASVMPALRGQEAVTYLKEQGLHSSLGEAIAAARYGVHWSEHTPWKDVPGAFYAGNPAQQMTAFFAGEGIHLESKSASDKKWRMEMKLTGLGYGERILPVAAGALKVTGNRIDIARPFVSDQDMGQATDNKGRITEWYVNRAEGIEQGFILTLPPGERREGERLTLRLEVGGDVKAMLVDEGRGVDLIAAGGERALSYDKLHVYDAAGMELEAGMRVQGGKLWLDVDEREAVYPVTIDPVFSQQQQLIAPDGAANDLFGFSVAISGETVVVGAVTDNSRGLAYVFVRAGGVWSLQQKLIASGGALNDQFGYSVSISGETIVVGSPGDEIGPNINQGSAYVFTRAGTVWTEQQRLFDSDGAVHHDDDFGISVAISGETIVVGAHTDVPLSDQGSAYVFERVGAVWSLQQRLIAPDGEDSDLFGNSVAISGETIVVGAWLDDVGANAEQGSAYVFDRAGTVWNLQQKLTAPDGEAVDVFGYSVAISGGTIVASAHGDDVGTNADQGSAYVFERAGTVWSLQQKLTTSDGEGSDQFGRSVAISGETIAVGALFDDVEANADQGSAYVFVRASAVWGQQKLTASDGAVDDQFGVSVAINGETIVVGAAFDDVAANEDQGSSYIFTVPDADVPDADGDGIADANDNCPNTANSDQANFDNDAFGDACDPDDDNDGDPDTTDCNDTNPAIHTGAVEVCDGIDNNCNGVTDEGFSNFDGDGQADCVDPDDDNDNDPDTTDCNDTNAAIHTGAVEVCDGIDNDCDGQVDEGVTTTFYRDVDGDGFGNPGMTTQACSAPPGYVSNNADCNDANAAIHKGAVEVCDGIDNDCDGQVDGGVTTTFYRDVDGDGFGNPGMTTQACSAPPGYVSNNADCNDANAGVHPGAVEACDGLDNNCNGVTDEGFPNSDLDGQADCVDPDDDNDGVPDGVDNCPFVPNPAQANADGDALGDACDPTPNGDMQLVFSSSRDGNFEIYEMRVDGTGVVRLTNNRASDLDPALSPDRTKIVFTSTRDGNFEIYSMNADGTQVTRLTKHSAIDGFAAWSPTGAKIAFSSTRDGNSEIYSMNADGTGVKRLTNNSRIDGNPAWSPDGSKIAFVSTRHNNYEIYSMNSDGSGVVTRLTNNKEEDAFPTWSPDGTTIAFMSTRDGNAEIYSMNANGKALTRLTNHSAIDAEPAWGANGKIAFTSTRNGNSEIYSMNANGTGVTRLTNHSAWDISPHW